MNFESMKKGIRYISLIMAIGLSFTACKKQERYFPAELPATHVEIVRFDSALLYVDTAHMQQSIRQLYTSYPTFMPYFAENILGIEPQDTAYLAEALPLFLNDTLYGFKQTNQRVLSTFAHTTDIQSQLNGAFSRLKYLYPNLQIPTIYFFVSGFNASILFFEDNFQHTNIAVGVDMYLDSDYEFYNRVVYNYQKQTMRKECIAADVVSAFLFRTFPFTSNQSRLLENMIYRGKIMYVLSLLFPTDSEAEIMGYTADQMAWCKRHESDVWKLIIDKKDLFTTDSQVLTSYLNDGPFTSEISQESPGRLGTWIGWQICKSYMENNTHLTLQELLAESDAQKILEQSYYKP